jgi:hypothetical protein
MAKKQKQDRTSSWAISTKESRKEGKCGFGKKKKRKGKKKAKGK